MRMAATTLFALSSRSILLALALGADRAISMSNDCTDRLRRVGLCLVKAIQYSLKRIFVVEELEQEFEGLEWLRKCKFTIMNNLDLQDVSK